MHRFVPTMPITPEQLDREVDERLQREHQREVMIAQDESTLVARPITKKALGLLVEGAKINAVRHQRDATGVTLLQAKHTVDAIERMLNRFTEHVEVDRPCSRCCGVGHLKAIVPAFVLSYPDVD